MNKNFEKIRRVDVLMFFILISILIIIFRCFNLQYTEAKKYSSLISGIEIKEHIIKTSRGSIVDKNNIVLAESILMDSLIVTNTNDFIENKDGIEKLCNILNISCENLLSKIENRKNKNFKYLKRYIHTDTTKEIKKLNLKGIGFIKEYQRYYPEGESISSLIGLLDFHHNGQSSLEKSFNKTLSGIDGKKKVMRDRQGKVVKEIKKIKKPIEGQKLSLTIDARLQYIAYRELKTNK